jgi:hypothetical protein
MAQPTVTAVSLHAFAVPCARLLRDKEPAWGTSACFGHDGIIDGDCDCLILRGLGVQDEVLFAVRPVFEGLPAQLTVLA